MSSLHARDGPARIAPTTAALLNELRRSRGGFASSTNQEHPVKINGKSGDGVECSPRR
jgi:hypothetical protein